MKRLCIVISILCVFIMSAGLVTAEEVIYQGSCTVNSRSDLSDLEGYTIIDGSLKITRGSTFNVTSLLSLRDLKEIRGDLIIDKIGIMLNLEGLENLTSIEGNLRFTDVVFLNYLDGLKNLARIGGGLTISMCPDLRTLRGLENITTLNSVYIKGLHGHIIRPENGTIYNLDGLKNLESVENGLSIVNTDVPSIEFDKLATCGTLTISENSVLTEIKFNNLETLSNTYIGLRIYDNGELTGLEFNSLEYIAGNVYITENRLLPTQIAVDLTENVTIDGTVIIEGNLD